MYAKKRIEIIIEKPAYKRAGRVLQRAGVTGYTVSPALAGFGDSGMWSRDTDISGSRDMVTIVTITTEETATKALEQLSDLLGDHIGIVSISDVEVLRDERF
ncbi:MULTISPECIES: DUF190 domain-containing protein [unclassified Lentilitoribacter]|uniref:DUF190 domain-containing protein n=1 Tax=unclassified Lentilitoribacter TaxID=2647570 RepID=UPI0013A6BE2A|nr:DUF190 domain-containing protein [Lentilitoribacter sp. Alg239-R112]